MRRTTWYCLNSNFIEICQLNFGKLKFWWGVDSFHLGTRNFPIFTVLPAAKPVGANGGDKVSVTWVTGFQMLFFPSWCRWFLVATHPSQVAVGPSACTSTALIPARGTMRSISSSSPWRVFYFRPTQKTAQARKKEKTCFKKHHRSARTSCSSRMTKKWSAVSWHKSRHNSSTIHRFVSHRITSYDVTELPHLAPNLHLSHHLWQCNATAWG